MEEKPVPIYIMRASDVTLEEKEAVIEAIKEVIALADSPRKKEIVDLDCWKADGYKDKKDDLVPGKSVDWLFEASFSKEVKVDSFGWLKLEDAMKAYRFMNKSGMELTGCVFTRDRLGKINLFSYELERASVFAKEAEKIGEQLS